MRLNTCLWRPGRRLGNRHLRETSCVGRAWSSWESETAMGHPRAGHVQRSRPQESLAAGGWNPAWRTVFKGKPARARHNLCSERAEWSLDQRVRQKLRMQENRTKTQSPWPRYKIEVWSWCPTAKATRLVLFSFVFFPTLLSWKRSSNLAQSWEETNFWSCQWDYLLQQDSCVSLWLHLFI